MANLAGIGAAGFLGGAAERAKEERDKRFKREQDALQMYTQLMQAGWKPVDEKRGVPEGEAIQLTPIGAWLRPPNFGKEEAAQLELEKARLSKSIAESQLKEQLSREELVRLSGIISTAKNKNDLEVAGLYIDRLKQEYALKEQAAQKDEARTEKEFGYRSAFAKQQHETNMDVLGVRKQIAEMERDAKASGTSSPQKEWQAKAFIQVANEITSMRTPNELGNVDVPSPTQWQGYNGYLSQFGSRVWEVKLDVPGMIYGVDEYVVYAFKNLGDSEPTIDEVADLLMHTYGMDREGALKILNNKKAHARLR